MRCFQPYKILCAHYVAVILIELGHPTFGLWIMRSNSEARSKTKPSSQPIGMNTLLAQVTTSEGYAMQRNLAKAERDHL
uniref:Putative secreted protein n=1 Tax=Amblyomma parvum TaxID=251391 RepID=A0A023FYZ2_AMBPA